MIKIDQQHIERFTLHFLFLLVWHTFWTNAEPLLPHACKVCQERGMIIQDYLLIAAEEKEMKFHAPPLCNTSRPSVMRTSAKFNFVPVDLHMQADWHTGKWCHSHTHDIQVTILQDKVQGILRNQGVWDALMALNTSFTFQPQSRQTVLEFNF